MNRFFRKLSYFTLLATSNSLYAVETFHLGKVRIQSDAARLSLAERNQLIFGYYRRGCKGVNKDVVHITYDWLYGNRYQYKGQGKVVSHDCSNQDFRYFDFTDTTFRGAYFTNTIFDYAIFKNTKCQYLEAFEQSAKKNHFSIVEHILFRQLKETVQSINNVYNDLELYTFPEERENKIKGTLLSIAAGFLQLLDYYPDKKVEFKIKARFLGIVLYDLEIELDHQLKAQVGELPKLNKPLLLENVVDNLYFYMPDYSPAQRDYYGYLQDEHKKKNTKIDSKHEEWKEFAVKQIEASWQLFVKTIPSNRQPGTYTKQMIQQHKIAIKNIFKGLKKAAQANQNNKELNQELLKIAERGACIFIFDNHDNIKVYYAFLHRLVNLKEAVSDESVKQHITYSDPQPEDRQFHSIY